MLLAVRIGEVARRVGLATSAIRFYEERGLIPEPERTNSGYRDYDAGVIERLEFIGAGQAVGLTLHELNQVLQIRDRGDAPCRHVTDLLDARIHEVDERIEELTGLRDELSTLRRRARDVDPAACPPESVCQIIVSR